MPPMLDIYSNDKYDRTKETFVDGWVCTGDEVRIEGGEIYIVDRLKVRLLPVNKIATKISVTLGNDQSRLLVYFFALDMRI